MTVTHVRHGIGVFLYVGILCMAGVLGWALHNPVGVGPDSPLAPREMLNLFLLAGWMAAAACAGLLMLIFGVPQKAVSFLALLLYGLLCANMFGGMPHFLPITPVWPDGALQYVMYVMPLLSLADLLLPGATLSTYANMQA